MGIEAPAGLKNASEEQLTAIMEVMYYVAKSDGVFSHEELMHFIKVAEGISGGRLSAAKLAILVNGWDDRPDQDLSARFQEMTKLLTTSYEREMACNLAAQLAEADDAVLKPEKDVLELLGRTFFPR